MYLVSLNEILYETNVSLHVLENVGLFEVDNVGTGVLFNKAFLSTTRKNERKTL